MARAESTDIFFSVIIPAYNAARFVEDAIESIQSQTFKDWEIVLVDDGSVDDTLRIAKKFESPRVKVISQHNMGVSKARTTAIQNSSGRYLYFMDSDDLAAPHALACCAKALVECDFPPLLFHTGHEFFIGQPPVVATWNAQIDYSTTDLSTLIADQVPVTGAFLVAKSDLLRNRPYSDIEGNGEDYDCVFSFGEMHGVIHLKKPNVLFIRSRPDSLSRNFEKGITGIFEMMRKHTTGKYQAGGAISDARFLRICKMCSELTDLFIHSGRLGRAAFVLKEGFKFALQEGRPAVGMMLFFDVLQQFFYHRLYRQFVKLAKRIFRSSAS